MYATNLPWEDHKPLPPNFDGCFTTEKTPYYPEEQEFYRTHASEEELKKGKKGRIFVAYNACNGKAIYATSEEAFHANREKYRAALGLDECFSQYRIAKRQDRKNGIRNRYVDWQLLNINGEPYLVLRVYTLCVKVLRQRERAETLYEVFRIIMRNNEVWEENRKGLKKSQWGDGGVGWSKILKESCWYKNSPARQDLDPVFEMSYTFTTIKDVLSFDIPYSFLMSYRQIPKKTFIFKNVPDEVRQDLTKEYPYFTKWIIDKYFVIQGGDQERLYVGKNKVYRFAWNPFSKQYCSATKARNLPRTVKWMRGDPDDSVRNKSALWDGSSLEGLAKGLYHWFENNKYSDEKSYLYIAETLQNALKYPCQEQLIKMGWVLAAHSFRHLRADQKGNKSLPEILHIPGSALKHLYDSDWALLSMAEVQEERNQMIEDSEKQGFKPDMPSLYHLYMMAGRRTWELFAYYVENGKPFQPFLSAILKRAEQEDDENSEDNLPFGNLYDNLAKRLINEYLDYLRMRKDILSYMPEISLPAFLKPSEIISKHREATQLTNEHQAIIKIQKEKKLEEQFRIAVSEKNYCSLNYENDQYVILSPEKAEDLIMEGASLHHCVGSYVKRVAEGESQIYFLRKKDTPSLSYCTIEIRKENSQYRMYQCYNAYDTHDKDMNRINFIKEWSDEKGILISCQI